MVKSVVSVICAIVIVFSLTLFEQVYVRKQFDEFSVNLEILYNKVDNGTANKQDVFSFEKVWFAKKKKLHVFIPHNDIKEIELWIGETLAFVEQENYKEAVSKLEVLRLLTKEIPKTFTFSLENIF